jgi:hypothetical protein
MTLQLNEKDMDAEAKKQSDERESERLARVKKIRLATEKRQQAAHVEDEARRDRELVRLKEEVKSYYLASNLWAK